MTATWKTCDKCRKNLGDDYHIVELLGNPVVLCMICYCEYLQAKLKK